MIRHIDYEIRLIRESKTSELDGAERWHLREYDKKGVHNGECLEPYWNSMHFKGINPTHSVSLYLDKGSSSSSSIRESIYIDLYPLVGHFPLSSSQDPVSYSMMGTNRSLESIQLVIRPFTEEKCFADGAVSCTSDGGINNYHLPDFLQISIYVRSQRYEDLLQLIEDKKYNSIDLRISMASGFYAEKHHFVGPDKIKILSDEQEIIDADLLEMDLPRLGVVQEFSLSLEKRDLSAKKSFFELAHINYNEYKDKSKEKHFPGLDGGETLDALNAVFSSVERYIGNARCIGTNLDYSTTEYFEKACGFVKELRKELNPLSTDSYPTLESKEVLRSNKLITDTENCDEWISYHLGRMSYLKYSNMIKGRQDSMYYWPIPNLDNIGYEYIENEFLHCDEIDKIIVRSLIQSTFQDYVISFYQMQVTSDGFLGFRSTSENFEKSMKRRYWFIATRNSLHNISCLVLGISAALMTQWWVGPVVWALSWNLLTARVYFKYWDEQKDIPKTEKNITRVYHVVEQAYSVLMTPTLLKERMKNVESEDFRFPTLAYVILDKMIDRDVKSN